MPAAAILWDIDGTLLRAAGTGVRCFRDALLELTGQPFPRGPFDMSGQTDPTIAEMVLTAAGHERPADGDPSLVQQLLARVDALYAANEAEFATLTDARPGVHALLDALHECGAVQTVVTGNIEGVARRKVRGAAVDAHLQLELGGYGSDHHLRAELVRVSRARLAAAGHHVPDERTWVIGDTPRDLRCARDNGVRCLLVATGTHELAGLAALEPDAAVADLTDLAGLIELLVG